MKIAKDCLLLNSADVMQVLGCSKSSAERCIREVNQKELSAGRFILRGKVNRYAFFEAVGLPYDKGALL